MADKKIGTISHYYGKIGVAIVDLTSTLKQGDQIKITGKSSEITQKADSMEFDHKKIKSAGKGKSIGLKVDKEVHDGDVVYKIN